MIDAITSATTGSSENYATAGGVATEALSNIRTVTSLNAQPDIISRYRIYLLEAMQIGIKKGAKVGAANGGLFCAAFLTYSLGFWYGGKLVADKETMVITILLEALCYRSSFALLWVVLPPGQVVPPITAFMSAKAAVGPMLEVIEREPRSMVSQTMALSRRKLGGGYELKDITFAYPVDLTLKFAGLSLVSSPAKPLHW